MIAPKRLLALHHGAMYLAALLSFLAVASDGPGRLLGIIVVISLPLSWIAHTRGWLKAIPTTVWNITLLGAIALTGVQLYATDQAIITTGVRFILMLLLIKLYSRKGARDDWQIYALGFLLMSAGTAINEDLAYGLIFALYVITCTFGLAMFHLNSEVEISRRGMGKNPLSRLYVISLVILALGVFFSSVGIFFTFPRVGLGFFATKSREASSMAGFNDKVELGSHGLIGDNPTVALRVEFLGEDGLPVEQAPVDYETFHWRILGFDQYDGKSWARTIKKPNTRPLAQKEDGTFKLYQFYTKPMEKLLEQTNTYPKMRMYLEPLGTTQLPILWPSVNININGNGLNLPFDPSSGRIEQTSQGDVSFERRNQQGVIYGLKPHKFPALTNFREVKGEFPLEVTRHYLQLPEDTDRIKALTTQITQAEAAPFAKAEAIEAYLEANYEYTRNLPEIKGGNPVNSFLFETKKGHCEYYATSMVLMLRSVGVPARLVNGFLGGQWYGGYLAVRQGDAHAWVEVYIPDYGWVPFDPTPSGIERPPINAMRDWFNKTYDTMRFGWNKWVLEYDLARQIDALRQLSQVLSPKSSFLNASSSGDEGDKEKKDDQLPLRTVIIIVGFSLICLSQWGAQRALKRRGSPQWSWVIVGVLGAGVGAGWMAWFVGPQGWTLGVGVGGPTVFAILAHVALAPKAPDALALSHALFLKIERAVMRLGDEHAKRAPDEGPQAYLERLAQLYPQAAQELRVFSKTYLKVRFGGESLDEETRQALERLARQIAARLRG